MNVVALYPGVGKGKNDIAEMLVELSNNGVNLSIFASRALVQKGQGSLSSYEDMDGIPIYRIFNKPFDMFNPSQKNVKECLALAKAAKPDLIFCSQEFNMRLALELQKSLHVPIVLLVEDAGRLSTGKAHRSLPRNIVMALLGVPRGPKFWTWLCKGASAIVTCHPRDQSSLVQLSQHNKPVYYLPWPTYVPADFSFPLEKNKNRAIFVGSLYPFKNTQEFEITLPMILKETPTKELLVIGPGPHSKIIQKLSRQTAGTIKHLYGLPRLEALRLIAESYYAYTPVIVGGWGFIGDCWSVKTPLVMSHNDNYVVNNFNALVSEDFAGLISNINRLYDDPECYRMLQQNGLIESKKKTAKIVADGLYQIFQKTLDNPSLAI